MMAHPRSGKAHRIAIRATGTDDAAAGHGFQVASVHSILVPSLIAAISSSRRLLNSCVDQVDAFARMSWISAVDARPGSATDGELGDRAGIILANQRFDRKRAELWQAFSPPFRAEAS
jgi:hypothetical protein